MKVFAPLIHDGMKFRSSSNHSLLEETEEQCRQMVLQAHSAVLPIMWMKRDEFGMPDLWCVTAGLSRDDQGNWVYGNAGHTADYTGSYVVEEPKREIKLTPSLLGRVLRAKEDHIQYYGKAPTDVYLGEEELASLATLLSYLPYPETVLSGDQLYGMQLHRIGAPNFFEVSLG